MVEKDYIDRCSLMKKVHTGMNIIEAMQAIIDAPAADVRPVIRGEWIKQEPYNQNYWKCSNCGETNKYAYRDGDVTIYELQDFFCPNCGADMREADT